jgi:glycosyltransferase involved in cell wall biosynthesis
MGISVIVHTLNEESNIANCLESVKWAEEILVIDMHSSDRTRDIAAAYTDRILLHPPMQFVEPARQFALEQVTNEWVLIVDADELVPRNLRDELLRIASDGRYDAADIPHRNFFFGHEMQGAEWGPLQNRHLRFFKKWVVKHSDQMHNFGSVDKTARIFRIDDPMCAFVHFNYLDVEHFFEKSGRYTTITAESQGPLAQIPSISTLMAESLREFYWRYFKRKGYKDGVQGFCLSLYMVTYRIVIMQKRLLMAKYKTTQPRQAIAQEYQQVADDIIAQYEI